MTLIDTGLEILSPLPVNDTIGDDRTVFVTGEAKLRAAVGRVR